MRAVAALAAAVLLLGGTAARAEEAPPGDGSVAHAESTPPAEAGTASRTTAPPFEAGGVGALLFGADPRGYVDTRQAYGLRAGLDLPLPPRPWFLRADALWLRTSWDGGTEAVRVTTAVDTLGLLLAAGHEWLLTDGVWLSPYLTGGPTLIRTGLEYLVDDPLAPAALREDLADWAPGAAYGAGARLAVATGPDLALALRLEALGLRRGVADDVALAASLGLLF